MNTRNLPVLVDNRILRILAFALLYAAQGLPFGLFVIALPTWLASKDYSSTEVGLFMTAVTLPWTLKLIAGPIMDRFAFLSMGRRRPWVLLAQSGILLGCLLLSAGPTSFHWLLAAGFFINFCAAWQDVAVDGMAIDILPENERARANAFMFGGQIAGMSASSAAGAWLLSNYGLGKTFLTMALCIALLSVIPFLFRERQGERLLPWTEGRAQPRSFELQETEWKRIFGNLVRVLILPMSLLLIVVRFGDRIASGILAAIFPVMTTQGLGYPETFFPELTAVTSIIAAVFCVLASPFIDRMTARRALFAGLIFKAVTMAAAGLAAPWWDSSSVMIGIVFCFDLSTMWLTVAGVSLFMNLCASKAAASQFAIYMALSNLALSVGTGLLGPLDNLLEFDQIFYIVAVMELAMLGLLFLFNLDQHKARLRGMFAAAEENSPENRDV
jgi:MFS transporter, PAT family, beta-lactamase induction signal transducer AmpG